LQDRVASLGIRAVACFEAAKGAIVLLAGLGLLRLVHHDAQALAAHIVRTLHLDPARRYPHIFLDAAARLSDPRLRLLAALALTYAVLRFIEAYGLWHLKAWAEWFAIVSGAVYLPVEAYEIVRHATGIRIGVFVVNAAIVAYLLYVRLSPDKSTTGT
jgi:uncharacterized membrane protein (DUF2068 family)